MKISPLDIVKKRFKKKIMGYHPNEVDRFLKEITEAMDELQEDLVQKEEELKALKEKMRDYVLKEDSLSKSLILAQKTAEERVNQAKKEAELLVEEAKQRAVRECEEFQAQRKKLKEEVEVLARQKEDFLIAFRTLLQQYLESLQANG